MDKWVSHYWWFSEPSGWTKTNKQTYLSYFKMYETQLFLFWKFYGKSYLIAATQVSIEIIHTM